ncbi:MAG: hypothetical protein AB9836_04675 [Aminipila sp.]
MGKTVELVSYEEIPKYTGLEQNGCKITINDGCIWEGDSYATCVGRILDDGRVESCFKSDIDNNCTEIFDNLRKDMSLLKKHVSLRNIETMEATEATNYYIPYKVKNHSSDKPTITNAYVDNCCNVHYDVEYEILLVADEGLRKYITIGYITEGPYSSSFFNQVEIIESTFEEFFENKEHGFFEDEDQNKMVAFYDEIGEKLDIEVCSVSELLSMVSSIRVIKCDKKIINKK